MTLGHSGLAERTAPAGRRIGERPPGLGNPAQMRGVWQPPTWGVWGTGAPQHSAPIPFHTEGPCSHLDQTSQHRLSIMFDLLARS